MHELSIAQTLVEAAAQAARAAGAACVARVELRLGSLAGVDAEALSFCFPIAARGTVCERADLRVAVVPAAGRCPACGASFPVYELHEIVDRCPDCGAWPLTIEGGREMVLASLEVA